MMFTTHRFRHLSRNAALLVLTLLLSGCEAGLFAGLNTTDRRSGIEAKQGIVFDSQHQLKLDVYEPSDAKDAPVVVFFYGGSWKNGKRNWYRFVGTALASRGIVAVIPDYRKYPHVTLDGFMQDAANAVAWMHRHAVEFGGNSDNVFVMGHSAGGQIGALLLTDPSWLAPYHLRPTDMAGFIGLAGCYAFTAADRHDKDMQSVFGQSDALWASAQPVNFVSGHEPPMLLLQGTADREVDPSNAIALSQTLRSHGDAVTLKLYPGVGHHSLIFALTRPMKNDAPTLEDITNFIRAHSSSSGR
jgi:acetyl esterase/lipase